MSKLRYYIDTHGNDDNAYAEAIKKACEIAKSDLEISKVTILVHNKNTVGWFERLYTNEVVKKLYLGVHFKDCSPLYKIETIRTYRDSYKPSEVLITCGLDLDEILKFEDYLSVKVIIAIPWVNDSIKKWVQTWSPIELRGKLEIVAIQEPSCIIKKALKDLTESINMSTGIKHSSDNDLAKTYILALHKHELLDPDVIQAYLLKALNWQSEFVNDVIKLVTTLNNNNYFQGGDRNNIDYHYERWRKECD